MDYSSNIKKAFSMMLLLVLTETMDQLTMVNSVHWFGHMSMRGDGLDQRMVLVFVVEGQKNRMRMKRMWKQQVGEEIVKSGIRGEDAVYWSK